MNESQSTKQNIKQPNFVNMNSKGCASICADGRCRSLWRGSIIVVLLLSSGCCGTANYMTPGETIPGSLELEVGGSANITCRMNPAMFVNQTSEDLYFDDVHAKQRVPKRDIIILNSTTIVFMLRKAQEDIGLYRCKVGTAAIMDTKVYVGYKPQPVNDFQCRSYDYAVMQCNFTKPNNLILTQYNVSFRSEYDPYGYRYPTRCHFEKTLVVCVYNTSKQEIYHCKLTGTNSLGSLEQNFPVNLSEINVPARPGQDFKVDRITTNSANFTWRIPPHYRSKALQWEVLLQLQNLSMIDLSNTVSVTRAGNGFFLRLDNLDYAYYWYVLRLRMRLQTSPFWSDPFTYRFRTKACRPDRPPSTDVGSFYIDRSKNKVTLYWELLEPHEYNGDNFTYVIDDIRVDGVPIELNPDSMEPNSAVFLWQNKSVYRFSIRSKNIEGMSQNASYIVVPNGSHTLPAVHNVYHEAASSYTVTWEPPKETEDLVDYTVFWCRSKRAYQIGCEGSIHFQHVPPDTHKFLTKPQNYTSNLAVSANYKNFNTGMHFSECTAGEDSDLVKMEPDIQATSATTFKIRWGWEKVCASLFDRYNLSYCEVGASESDLGSGDYSTSQDLNCSYVLVNKTYNLYELRNLKPYTPYNVQIFMYSQRKAGKKSDPHIEKTLEAAPSPPREVAVSEIRNTSAIIKWLPPNQPNGRIRTYIVQLNGLDIPVRVNNSYEPMVYELQSLTSYTSYTVSVLAQTVNDSLPSNNVHFTSLIGFPTSPVGLYELNRTNGIVTIAWSEPTEKAGRLDFYEVEVAMARNGEVESRRISIVMDTDCQLQIPECFDHASITTVRVRAVNAALLTHEVYESELKEAAGYMDPDTKFYEGANELRCSNEIRQTDQEQLNRYFDANRYRLYKSPWSSSTPFYCSMNSWSTIVGYVAVVISMIAILFMAINSARQKYYKMANIQCILPAGLDAYMTKDTNTGGSGNGLIGITGFSHDFITALKGEASNTQNERMPPEFDNARMQGCVREDLIQNEEHRLLEATSQDSVFSQQPPQHEGLSSQATTSTIADDTVAPEIPMSAHRIDIFSKNNENNSGEYFHENSLESNDGMSATDLSYVQASDICRETPSQVRNALAMSMLPSNCYIKPSAITNWQRSGLEVDPVPSGYVTIESIDTPIANVPAPKSTSNLVQELNNASIGNGYVHPDVLSAPKINLNSNFSTNLNTSFPPSTLVQSSTSPTNFNLPSSDGYTTLEQLGKMVAYSTETDNSNSEVDINIGSNVEAFVPGISGYVTQRELNAFGQQQQQSGIR